MSPLKKSLKPPAKTPKNSLKSKKPLVSFVIRTKNEARWIGKILKILYQQTFKNFEVIIVDSESVDKTLEIVKKFPVRLIQIKQKEFGHSYALNLGIKNAKGKYIGIISGHSIPISNNWLKDGLKNFKNSQVAAVSGYYSISPVGYFFPKLGRLLILPFLKIRKDFFPWMTNTNALIRKNLWKKYPFNEKLPECEDYDWGREMIARGYNVIKDPKFNVFHSHFLVGRPGFFRRLPRWKKICAMIDKRKRPRKSFTRLKI